MGFLLGRTRRKYRLTDVVTQYCDKRDECSSKTCPFLSATGIKIEKGNVAYVEVYHCPKYRPVEGGAAGTEIREMGVWK